MSERGNSGLKNTPAYGVGLALGMETAPGFNIGAVDVDDDKYVNVVAAILDDPISHKRGAKGATFFVNAPADEKIKSTSFKDYQGKHVGDLLMSGKMTVLPPSLHPNGEVYAWTGKPLLDCAFKDLPLFNKRKAKLLSFVLASEYTPILMTGIGTHDAGLRFAAQLVSNGFTDEEIETVIKALLPKNYLGNSLDELPGWISDARQKGFDEPVEGEGSLLQQVAHLVSLAGAKLFHDGDRAFATVPVESGELTYSVDSENFKRWMRRQAHIKMGRPVSKALLNDAVAAIETDALFTGELHAVEIRIGGDANTVEIDLGHSDGSVARITKLGWEIGKGNQRFYRSAGFGILPSPEHGGDLKALQELLGLDNENYYLLLAFIVNALKPTGPYFCLLVEGEQGSGKSFLCFVVKMLIDPNKAARLHIPDNIRDLLIQAKEFRLLPYDNASGMKTEISDTLCGLATGSGIAVRKLYTNDDLQVLTFTRPFVINGISGYAKRPDLLERGYPDEATAYAGEPATN